MLWDKKSPYLCFNSKDKVWKGLILKLIWYFRLTFESTYCDLTMVKRLLSSNFQSYCDLTMVRLNVYFLQTLPWHCTNSSVRSCLLGFLAFSFKLFFCLLLSFLIVVLGIISKIEKKVAILESRLLWVEKNLRPLEGFFKSRLWFFFL